MSLFGTTMDDRYPSGYLMETPKKARQGVRRWAWAEQNISVLEAALGMLLLVLSFGFFFQYSSLTGKALGAILLVAGALGWFGGHTKSANATNLQLILSVVGIMLALQFVGEVVKDTHTDCALAELYYQNVGTRKELAALKNAGTINAVFNRLDELEDMLTLAQQSAVKQVELKQSQESLKNMDLNYIQRKVEMLKKHGEKVLDSVLNNPQLTTEVISKMDDATKDMLRKRLDVADRVLDRIRKHHSDPKESISYEEYEELLHALEDPASQADSEGAKELTAAKGELPNMRAALERHRSGAYHTLMVGEAHTQLQQIEEYRAKRREEWNTEFAKHLEAAERNGGNNYLADLPEHCVRETAGEKVMVALGFASVLLQLVASYTSLSLSFRLPIKGE